MTSKNETTKRKGRKKITVTVMLLERFQEDVPKRAIRRKLEEEKVKKLFVSRADTHEDLDKCICWIFGIHNCDWIYKNRLKGTFCISRNINLKY